MRVGDPAGAIALMEGAAGIAPQSVAAWTNLGALYSRAGRFDEAIVYTERALAISPRTGDYFWSVVSIRT